MSEAAIRPVETALGLSFQYDLGNGRAVVIQTHLARNTLMPKDLDAELDLVLNALDRKKAKYELVAKAQEIAEQKGALRGVEAKLANLNQLYGSKKVLPRQEEANKHNMEINVEMCRGRIEALEEQYAKLQKLAA